MKSEHRLERNRLKGTVGDAINAILSAAAMNFQKLQGFSWRFLRRLLDVSGGANVVRSWRFENGHGGEWDGCDGVAA
jgi:hypothetical protein